MEINWEEILKSPELTELVFKKSGLSKEEWDETIKEEDYDWLYDPLNEALDEHEDVDFIFGSNCVSFGYDNSYTAVRSYGLFFVKDTSADQGWAGPYSTLEEFYDLGWFSDSAEAGSTEFTVSTSLDDETIFKIIGVCYCPVTLNDEKYIHNGTKYVKAN